MCKGLLAITIIVFFSNACVTAVNSSKPKTGLLCEETSVRGEQVVDCLNPLSADSQEVRRRVVLYNKSQKEEDRINCVYKKSLGSRFTRWGCYFVNSPNANPSPDIGLLDLIDKGNTL